MALAKDECSLTIKNFLKNALGSALLILSDAEYFSYNSHISLFQMADSNKKEYLHRSIILKNLVV
jgi:hypothetical protein